MVAQRRFYTEDETMQIIADRRQGVPFSAIARKLNHSTEGGATSSERKPEPDPRYDHVEKPRKCLTCRKVFKSEWFGNWRCRQCKDSRTEGGII